MILGPDSPCFQEIDEAVRQLQRDRGDDREVVFFWQHDVSLIPEGAIVYNFDLPLVHFDVDHMRAAAKRASEVWDFSERGVEVWRRIGVEAKHVPVGFHESMVRFDRAKEPDIDVVFVGSLNARRVHVLNLLRGMGMTVALVTGENAAYRDALLARARCSINVLFYETGMYPMLRAAHLVANGVPFASEAAKEAPSWMTHVSYGELADAVVDLARDGDHATECVDANYAIFKRMPLVLPS